MKTFSARETAWLQELDGIELAGFRRRAFAFLIDWIIVGLLLSLVLTSGTLAYVGIAKATGHGSAVHINFGHGNLTTKLDEPDQPQSTGPNANPTAPKPPSPNQPNPDPNLAPKIDPAASDSGATTPASPTQSSGETHNSATDPAAGKHRHVQFQRFHPDEGVFTEIGNEALKIFTDIVVPCLYFGLYLWRWNGQTPGKRLMKIRVVSLVHRHMTFWHSVERALGYGAAALEAGFGFFQFWIHPYRRCAQDRLAETIVVMERSYAKHLQNIS